MFMLFMILQIFIFQILGFILYYPAVYKITEISLLKHNLLLQNKTCDSNKNFARGERWRVRASGNYFPQKQHNGYLFTYQATFTRAKEYR